jgi:hypothetical protein
MIIENRIGNKTSRITKTNQNERNKSESNVKKTDIVVSRAGNLGWAFWASMSTPENKNPKHGPARNNMGQASTVRRRAWAGP